MGTHPCVFTEIGIPFDMDDKYAYKTGDYISQIRAMDANHFALEGSGANGFTLWVYVATVRYINSLLRYLANISRTTTNGATFGTEKISLSIPSMTNPSPWPLLNPSPRMPQPFL